MTILIRRASFVLVTFFENMFYLGFEPWHLRIVFINIEFFISFYFLCLKLTDIFNGSKKGKRKKKNDDTVNFTECFILDLRG